MTSGVFKTIPSKDIKLHDKFYAHKLWSDVYTGDVSSDITYEVLSTGSYENEACRKYAMINTMFFEYNSNCYSTFEYIQNSAKNIQIDTQYQIGNTDISNQQSNNYRTYKHTPNAIQYKKTVVNFTNPLPDEIICISIPQSKIGMHIDYGSVSVTIRFFRSSIMLVDNGRGELVYNNNVYGRIMYSCGIIIIYNKDVVINDTVGEFRLYPNATRISWKSTVMLYQNHVLIRTKKNEFNVSMNPTLIDDVENGILKQDIVKLDTFNPYITTIGLYNDSGDLLAVARLSKPIPKRHDIDINFLIKWDY